MKKARIFVVEDEALVAEDIEISLENMNYAVSGKASTGEDAIINVGKNRPDLVLMDINLKREMSGIEAASQIRDLFNIPVIYLTAHANDEVLQSAKLTGPFGYIFGAGSLLWRTFSMPLPPSALIRRPSPTKRPMRF